RAPACKARGGPVRGRAAGGARRGQSRRLPPSRTSALGCATAGYWALPMPTLPLMFAELTPMVTQFWSWVVGLNVSAASAPSPAANVGSSLPIVKLAGAVQLAGTLLATSVSVMLATTVPCNCTAANAPVVL